MNVPSMKRKPPAKEEATPPPNAFAALDMPHLPPGPQPKPPPASADPDAPQSRWKMGRVVLQRETAHRGGKTVIVIKDFASHLPISVIETIAKRVRAACGCGGTVRERRVEVQGDNVAKIRSVLETEGFQVAGVK